VPASPAIDHSATGAALARCSALLADCMELARESGHAPSLADLEKCALAAKRASATLATAAQLGEERMLHDLRNHLGAISGYLELLLEDLGDGIDARLDKAVHLLSQHVDALLYPLSPELPAISPANTQATQITNEPGTLLVIDDNEQSRELLGRYLRNLGHRVLVAESGARALEVLREFPVDLIFLDLVMPEMSGLELLQRIKSDARLRAVPVIIVSGMADTDGVIRCIENGADDYLNKPFNPTLLRARLNAGLQRKRWHDREEAYRRELERNQRFIRNTFGRYLSDEIVDALLETPEGLNLGGSNCQVTILMADIRNFSWICERHEPEQVVALLNNYLGVMSGIVMAHNGTVDEFIGDAILAIFGAPVTRSDDALRAVRCALQMQNAVADINRRNREQGLPEISIGIGLNTGEVVAGNIGSERRSKYAVVGHTVNLTARIESYTSGGEILAAQSTLDAIDGAALTGRCFSAQPKGMESEVTIHAITGLPGGIGETTDAQRTQP
jgi:adenylate cyclase